MPRLHVSTGVRIALTLLLLPAAGYGDTLAAGDSASRSAADSLAAVADSLGARDSVSAPAPVIEQVAVAPAETTAAPPASAPVFLGGHEIFRVRVGRGGLDPDARAAAIRERVNRAVGDGKVPADSVRLVASPEGINVFLGRHFLWLVTPADAQVPNRDALRAWVAGLPEQVRDGIERERASRKPLRLLISALVAVLLTIVAWALLRVISMGGARWRDWVTRSLVGRLPAIRFRSFEVISRAQLAGFFGAILGRLDVVVSLVLLYLYLTTVFSLFPWTQGWSFLLLRFAAARTMEVLAGIVSAVPNLIVIVIVIVIFRWLMGLSDRFFNAIASGTLALAAFHPELARPSKRLVRILLWIVALMVIYPYIPGSHSPAVRGVTVLVGLMVSLGSTGLVGNLIAGLVLTYSRSFQVGDRVRIADHVGDVMGLGFFATKLRTIHNEELTIANGAVVGGSILNYTRLAAGPGLVLHTQLTIGYDADWRKVHALLCEAALRVEGVEKEPEPKVFQRALNDSNVTYELTCVTRDSHAQLRLYSDLHGEIQDAFARAGIEILSPDYHALRDANAPVLPAEPGGPRAQPGGFRVRGEGDAGR